jgi:hypothetical protein
MEEAVGLLTRAAELTDDEHETALLWREIGHAQALRYDGEAFWEAMNRSLEGPLDDEERAQTYSLLAFQTSLRSGMWKVRPRLGQIETWVERSLELEPKDDAVRAQALLARANAAPDKVSESVLEEAAELAERVADAELRSHAFGARSRAAYEARQFDAAALWSERRLELVPEMEDPDSVCEACESAVPVAAMLGRFDEARRLAELHWQTARRLSAHHRLHSVSLPLELGEVLGNWQALADETDRVTEFVAANLATPCVRNARDLLLCAVAQALVGDEKIARELEREAESISGEGHDTELSTPRLRMALLRGDVDSARSLVGLSPRRTFVWGPGVFAARFDALTALRQYEQIEREAPLFMRPGTVPEPFALRALGAARRDDELLQRADERFRELGLDWHAGQTEPLLAGL